MPEITELLNMDSDFYWSIIFPIVIALSRIVDVVLGTFRIILVIQGKKILATIFGFFEVLIWVTVAGQVMGQLNNFSYYLAWSIGFASGTFIGMTIEEKISMGTCILRIIVKDSTDKLLKALDDKQVYSTVVDARSRDEKNTTLIFSIIARKRLADIEKLIVKVCPNAIYTIENVRSVHQANLAKVDNRSIDLIKRVFPRRKGK